MARAFIEAHAMRQFAPGKYAAIAASNLALLVALTIGLELAFGNWFEAFVPPQKAVVNRSSSIRRRSLPARQVWPPR
jgi:hypothetical protein